MLRQISRRLFNGKIKMPRSRLGSEVGLNPRVSHRNNNQISPSMYQHRTPKQLSDKWMTIARYPLQRSRQLPHQPWFTEVETIAVEVAMAVEMAVAEVTNSETLGVSQDRLSKCELHKSFERFVLQFRVVLRNTIYI